MQLGLDDVVWGYVLEARHSAHCSSFHRYSVSNRKQKSLNTFTHVCPPHYMMVEIIGAFNMIKLTLPLLLTQQLQ